jgi:hypothetical protein
LFGHGRREQLTGHAAGTRRDLALITGQAKTSTARRTSSTGRRPG